MKLDLVHLHPTRSTDWGIGVVTGPVHTNVLAQELNDCVEDIYGMLPRIVVSNGRSHKKRRPTIDDK